MEQIILVYLDLMGAPIKVGQLWGHFRNGRESMNTIAWEAVALSLGSKAGIKVPEWRIEITGRQQILLSRRFDREKNIRIPFLSAMSVLGAKDNEMH